MSDDRLFERRARAWLELGPTEAPDRPVQAALRAIESTSQERDLRILWRLPFMMSPGRLAAVAAIVAIVVVGGVFLLKPPVAEVGHPSSAPSGQPSSTPTFPPLSFPPVATPTPPVPGTTVLGEGAALTPGATYSTLKFNPPFTIQGIAGWYLGLEHPDSLWFAPSLDSSPYDKTPQIEIIRPAAVLPTWIPIGSPQPLPSDLIGWLRSRSDLTIGASSKVTVGGIAGTEVDGSVRSAGNTDPQGWMNLICTASVPSCGNERYAIGVGLGRPFRIIVLHVQGQTVVIGLNTGGTTKDFDALDRFLAGLHWVGAP